MFRSPAAQCCRNWHHHTGCDAPVSSKVHYSDSQCWWSIELKVRSAFRTARLRLRLAPTGLAVEFRSVAPTVRSRSLPSLYVPCFGQAGRRQRGSSETARGLLCPRWCNGLIVLDLTPPAGRRSAPAARSVQEPVSREKLSRLTSLAWRGRLAKACCYTWWIWGSINHVDRRALC
jgi:hypothetical protein